MLDSRSIDALRADVAANCRLLLARGAAQGLDILVTQTVRDEEYQEYLYAQGRTRPGAVVTNARTPSFHSAAAGLAFDVCKNLRGHEYDDAEFFRRVGELGKALGFSWGDDWASFPDRPHFQWDDRGAYTGAMIRAGELPPPMPYMGEEEDAMTQKRFDAMLEASLARRAAQEPGAWSAAARAWAEETGLIAGGEDGAKQYKAFLTREQAAVLMQRLAKLLERS